MRAACPPSPLRMLSYHTQGGLVYCLSACGCCLLPPACGACACAAGRFQRRNTRAPDCTDATSTPGWRRNVPQCRHNCTEHTLTSALNIVVVVSVCVYQMCF